MNPQYFEWAALLATPIASGIASWWGTSMRLARVQGLLEAQRTQLKEMREDIRYAHQRIDQLKT